MESIEDYRNGMIAFGKSVNVPMEDFLRLVEKSNELDEVNIAKLDGFDVDNFLLKCEVLKAYGFKENRKEFQLNGYDLTNTFLKNSSYTEFKKELDIILEANNL